ncbi:MAG: hypothetical protein MSA07_01785 [Mucispirillum sp.]|nr:hypothetical protein [Mucispirillum sp.]
MVKKYKNYIYIIIVTILYIFLITKQLPLPIYVCNPNDQLIIEKITANRSIREDIILNQDNCISSFYLKIGTYFNQNGSENLFNIYIDNQLKDTITFNTINLKNDSFNKFKLAKPLCIQKNHVFSIEWQGKGTENNSVTAYYSKKPSANKLYVNNNGRIEEISGELKIFITGSISLLDYLSNKNKNDVFIKFIDYIELINKNLSVTSNGSNNLYFKQYLDNSTDYYIKSLEIYPDLNKAVDDKISIIKNGKIIYEKSILSKDIINNKILHLNNINQEIKKGDVVYIKAASSYYTYKNSNKNYYKCSSDNNCIQADSSILYAVNNEIDYNMYAAALLKNKNIEYLKDNYYAGSENEKSKLFIAAILFILYILIIALIVLINNRNFYNENNK